jgi:hypothetical protein
MSQEVDNESEKLQSILAPKIPLLDSERINDLSLEQNGTFHQDKAHSYKRGSSPAARDFLELVHSLQGYDWGQLQERFAEEMDERSQMETTVQKSATDLLEVRDLPSSPVSTC